MSNFLPAATSASIKASSFVRMHGQQQQNGYEEIDSTVQFEWFRDCSFVHVL